MLACILILSLSNYLTEFLRIYAGGIIEKFEPNYDDLFMIETSEIELTEAFF